MTGLISELFSSFTTVITSLADGLKYAFIELLYDDYGGDRSFSKLAVFVFVMAGVGLATGVLYKIFGMIRARKG